MTHSRLYLGFATPDEMRWVVEASLTPSKPPKQDSTVDHP